MNKSNPKNFIIVSVFCLFMSQLYGQPVLVEDYTLGTEGSFNQYEYSGMKYGNGFIIPITHPNFGTELGYLDSSGLKVLKDIFDGTESSNPKNFIMYKNRVYFVAIDMFKGPSIWSTNGTAEDTRLELDLPGVFYPSNLIVSRSDKLYFVLNQRIYSYDGTTLKALVVFDKMIGDLCAFKDEIAFAKNEGAKLGLYVIENDKPVFKKHIDEFFSLNYSAYAMNELKNGLVICTQEVSGYQGTATYRINKNTFAIETQLYGMDRVTKRIEKLDDNKAIAAINGLGYYLLDGSSNLIKLHSFSSPTAINYRKNIPKAFYKNKIAFISNEGGPSGTAKVFYSDGTLVGTKELYTMSNENHSNMVQEGNFAFFASNIANGFSPEFYAINLETGKSNKLFTSNMVSNDPESVILLGVIDRRLYFYSKLDSTKGRELYYLNLDLQITDAEDIKPSDDTKICMYQNDFEIKSETLNSLDINVYTVDGKLLESRTIKTNTKYDLPKSNTLNIISVFVNGHTLSEKYFSN